MLQFLSNAFNDPSDPWYYVIGVIFLLLVFGALAFYILWSGKRKKQEGDEQDKQETVKAEPPAKDDVTESAEAPQQQDKE